MRGKQKMPERMGPVPKPESETLLGGAIEVHLHELLADRGMTLATLSERVGVTIVNLSVLKNGHARAIRFSTLARLCGALDCQPGDLLSWRRDLEGAPD
jgi:putative transcriptional regulator